MEIQGRIIDAHNIIMSPQIKGTVSKKTFFNFQPCDGGWSLTWRKPSLFTLLMLSSIHKNIKVVSNLKKLRLSSNHKIIEVVFHLGKIDVVYHFKNNLRSSSIFLLGYIEMLSFRCGGVFLPIIIPPKVELV